MIVLPTVPGFYWAQWRISDDDVPRAADYTPCRVWEVVEVFRNEDGELRVEVPFEMVGGHSIEGYHWFSATPLVPPTMKTYELGNNGERERAAYLAYKRLTPDERMAQRPLDLLKG